MYHSSAQNDNRTNQRKNVHPLAHTLTHNLKHIGLPLAIQLLRIWHFTEIMGRNIMYGHHPAMRVLASSGKCSSGTLRNCHPQRNYKYLGPPICLCNIPWHKRDNTAKSCNVIINVPIRNLCVAKTVRVIHPIIKLFFSLPDSSIALPKKDRRK